MEEKVVDMEEMTEIPGMKEEIIRTVMEERKGRVIEKIGQDMTKMVGEVKGKDRDLIGRITGSTERVVERGTTLKRKEDQMKKVGGSVLETEGLHLQEEASMKRDIS